MLRGVLASAAGVEEAIRTTAAGGAGPDPSRGAAPGLAARAGAPHAGAGAFAEEMHHTVADRIVVALQMAATRQTGRLREQLGAMARDTRMEVSRRQRIEAERASEFTLARNIVLLVAFMLVFFVVTRPEYMEPFGTAFGQAMLLGVGLLLGATLFVLMRMARVAEPRRILRVDGVTRGPDEGEPAVLIPALAVGLVLAAAGVLAVAGLVPSQRPLDVRLRALYEAPVPLPASGPAFLRSRWGRPRGHPGAVARLPR